tara:strand:+ start:5883 stop:6089 length:207 start_codon:yes stop_codon:yes gene_type:complete
MGWCRAQHGRGIHNAGVDQDVVKAASHTKNGETEVRRKHGDDLTTHAAARRRHDPVNLERCVELKADL